MTQTCGDLWCGCLVGRALALTGLEMVTHTAAPFLGWCHPS